MRKKEANLTAIMLVQQLEDEHWKTWQDKTALKQARDESNIRPLLETVTDKLNRADITVKEAYGIKHNKDEVNVWNQESMKNVIEKKAEHIHFLFTKAFITVVWQRGSKDEPPRKLKKPISALTGWLKKY